MLLWYKLFVSHKTATCDHCNPRKSQTVHQN